jgi:hypothetical protein
MQAALVAKKVLRAIDPNDDPSAEPLSPFALLALTVTLSISVFVFLRWRIPPMQDLGLHASMAAVVADYGKAGSIYPDIYKPPEILTTNSLLCTVAGLLGKVLPPATAFKLTLSLYLIGIPLATLYALRVFGRSAWGAVIAVALAYNNSFVYGFASFLFAGPLAVLSVPLFYRMLVRPTVWRVLAAMITVTLLFLAHQHVFLWTGVLLFTMSLIGILVTTKRLIFGLPTTKPWTIAWISGLAVLPALALLGRWAYRSGKPAAADELTLVTPVDPTWKAFVASLKPASRSFGDLQSTFNLTNTEGDHQFYAALFIVGVVCVAISRLHQWKRPAVLELACALTFVSFFLMPEDFAGQQVIASRQFGFGLWFAPVFFTPVPGRVTRLGRLFAIAGVISLVTFHLSYWSTMVRKFQRDEVAGFEEVMAAAPPRKRLHYVNVDPESKYFPVRTFWHVEKWYMLLKQGQCDENPAYSNMQPIRYRSSYELHRVESHVHSWPSNMEIWTNADLVLIRRWHPTPKDLELANQHGELLAKHGDWELWRSKLRP